MSETKTLSLEVLKEVLAGHAAALRCVTEYQPAGGMGDKVFPPTYEGGKYATEKRIDPKTGEIIDCVLLDSVQSQANRMERALLEAWRTRGAQGERRIDLPVVTVRIERDAIKVQFKDENLDPKGIEITSLDAPHRVADAILRDSEVDGVAFRKSDKGKLLDTAHARNATGLFGLNPTALVFGIWDSTGPRGGLGAKFQRALVSEMVGYAAQEGVNTGSRNDPLGILRSAGPIFRTEDGGWTADQHRAAKVGDKPALFGLSKGALVAYDEKRDQDQGAPSKINHGNVTPDYAFAKDKNGNVIYDEVLLDNGRVVKKPRIKGGFTIAYAKQTTVLSLATLRRLRFPLNGGLDSKPEVDHAARTALAALALLGAVLAREEGADLRSRCQLFPTEAFAWELLDKPGEEQHQSFTLTGEGAVVLFNDAVKEAKDVGLPWEEEILLQPSEDLIRLVAKSQELAMHQAEGSE
ncbi:MAG: type I-U CRISPR-associated protein Cas7 [Betaproteobacteria bacterium]|nr:type I-U CRISPR-associated protein Cas7 [Betaproteobacteria bacterium]